MKSESPWQLPDSIGYPSFGADLTVDALIIGGGISGMTAAYLLAKAGKSVALVERDTLVSGETGHTTAHITYPTDLRLKKLVSQFGENHAQAAWDAQWAACHKIADIVHSERLDVELRYVPGYLYAAFDANVEKVAPELMEESQIASDLGFDTTYVHAAPVVKRQAVRYANQMKFHPGKYVSQLAIKVAEAGGRIFEQSNVECVEDEPLRAKCNGHYITCQSVFIATHVPLQGISSTLASAMFQTKLAGYSSYAISAIVPDQYLPEALFMDTSDPYLYLRFDRQESGTRVIIGGEDHKTGQKEDTEECFIKLQTTLMSLFPDAELERKWSGQVIETNDGLPFIGEDSPGQFIATGFAGTGMTWGTVSGMMYCDYVMGVRNPWTDLFHVSRKPLAQTWDYLTENKDYPFYLVKGLFTGGEKDPEHLLSGEGKIMKVKGKKMAVCRDDDGKLQVHSAICPHMGCVVAWNPAEKTWDCPCHGSRFMADGQLMAGPAESGLKSQEEMDKNGDEEEAKPGAACALQNAGQEAQEKAGRLC